MNLISTLRAIGIVLVVGIVAICIASMLRHPVVCSGSCRVPQTGDHLLILLDGTASYAPYWTDSCNIAAAQLANVYGGEHITVIEITDSAVSDDIRLDATLTGGTIACMQQKAKIATEIRSMQPLPTSSGAHKADGSLKGKPWGTDLEGALDLAAKACAKSDKVTLLVFSDFEDSPAPGRTGATKHPMPFPADTAFKGLFAVESQGLEEYNTRLSKWVSVLHAMNTDATLDSFKMPKQALGMNPSDLTN